MAHNLARSSPSWISFSYANMVVVHGVTVGDPLFLPLHIWIEGYMLTGVAVPVTATIILT